MDCQLLFRPEVKVQKKTAKEKVLPADLSAAYACYHVNLVERRKLEQKLQIIDMETKQMKRNFQKQREVLEKEMKKAENDYWNCHRVFSAATLITESDSYRKRFYTGPQPTKAELPRRKLERLSQLVRILQAEDDLETLSRFQRCARYACRKPPEVDHETVSSLSLSQEGSGGFEPWEQQHLTEMRNERSTDKAGKSSSNTSIKGKRIRSAPPRVTPRTGTPGEFSKRRYSASPQQYSPKKLELDISQISSSKVERSKGVTHSGGRENASVRFAWTDKEKSDTTVDDVDAIDTSLSHATVKEASRDIDLMQTSPEHETSHSSVHQSCDANASSECQISRGSSDRISSHQDPLQGESSFVHVQPKETKISEPDYRDSKFSTTCQDQAYIEIPAVENQIGGGQNLELDSVCAKGATTARKGWDLIRIAYMDNKKSLVSSSCDILKNEDFTNILEERGEGRDVHPTESVGECSFRERAASQRNDNEAQHLAQSKRGDKGAEVTGNNTYGAALYTNEGTKTKRGRKISVALPKSSLHGLSSGRKSLTPRDHHKPSQNCASIKAEDKHEVSNNSAYLHAKIMMLPNNADKRPDKEKQAHKKKRLSIFKRGCLSDVLFSEQTQIESQLRNRVQGFLGAIHDADETSEKGTGEE